MRAVIPVILFMVALLAGCVNSADEAMPTSNLIHVWEGSELVGPQPDFENNPTPFQERPPRPTCDGANCERVNFTIPEHDGKDVLVAIEWEGQDDEYTYDVGAGGYLGLANFGLDLAVFQGNSMIADGEESLHYAGVTRLSNPDAGTYTAEIVAKFGTGTYIGAVTFVEPDAPVELAEDEFVLPDLVMLPPDHIQITAPIAPQANDVLTNVNPGCGPDETSEDQDLRCLRFAGILGNQGPGEFLAVLEYDQAVDSTAGDGHWEQVLTAKNGDTERVPIGSAEYHHVHGHYHILDFVETTLYEFDEDTQVRGEDTGFGRKTGFCIIDGGLIDPLSPQTEAQYHGTGCCYLAGFCQLDMASNPYFYMGMSAGWYDIYPWWRADQYVEVSGLEDGVYEMVSLINPDGFITETSGDNNEASTIFRLEGDTIELLEMRTDAEVGPHPDADWGYTGDPNQHGMT